jgi:hypothetical protein
MLEPGYQDRNAVEDALGCTSNRSLEAEVKQWNTIKKKIKHVQDQIQECKDQLFAISIDQWACQT